MSPSAVALRTLAAGDRGDMGASALAEDVEGRGAVGVHLSPGGDVRVAERFRLTACCEISASAGIAG